MTPRPGSQAHRVLAALQSGPCTTAELASHCPYGLSSVIANLKRQGYPIRVELVNGPPATKYAIYTLQTIPRPTVNKEILILDRTITELATKLAKYTGLNPQTEIATAINAATQQLKEHLAGAAEST